MNNISSLFENLMTYNESTNEKRTSKKKTIVEADQTLLNLTVELPNDTEDITPEDIKVDVGVMNIDDEGAEDTDVENDETSEDEEMNDVDEIDITPEDEENVDEKEPEEAEESLKLENKTKCNCTNEKDCKDCNTKKENKDVETAKANIRKRVNGKDKGIIGGIANTVKSTLGLGEKKEALMHLDTKSLNKLITEFVKENYKNIDKVTITKAVLENKKLTLKGYIEDINGVKESIVLVNRGFDANKLESTRFLIDFKDMSQTFNVIKESLKQPFVFTATMNKGVVKFESLKYNFKTQLSESKIARVFGQCVLKEN